MNSLTLIGALFLFGGLLVFSLKLISYNRKKYSDEDESDSTYHPTGGMNIYRVLSIVLILAALAIIYLFGD
jgi:uncharacterized membrane protein YidH (DUF202 family)